MTAARQRAAMAFRVNVQCCQHPGCQTLTTGRLCAKHRAPPTPAGSWAIAEQVRDEFGEAGQCSA